jgi:hypothetical protein
MMRVADRRRGLVRCFSFAAAAVLLLAAVPGERAEAMSPISPGSAPAAKFASGGLMAEVRFGHGGGGGHGGGFHGGGFHGGGFHGSGFHGGGFHGGGFRGGGWHGGGMHVGHWHGGGGWHRGWHGGGFHHGYRFHHHRRFYGGGYYYPAYYHHRRCRVIWTYYGPRRICRWHHWRHYW